MNMDHPNHVVTFRDPPRFFLRAWFDAFARRFPFVALVGVILASNLAGSFFNFFYNTQLIVERHLNETQRDVFWNKAAPLYNVLAYPLCFAVLFVLMWPVFRCLRRLRRGKPVEPAFLQFCQRCWPWR